MLQQGPACLEGLRRCCRRMQQSDGQCAMLRGQNSPEKPEKSEKQRTPAWTDRVLWRSRRGPQSTTGPAVRQIAYSSVSGMTFSDHRPVHALFCIQVRHHVCLFRLLPQEVQLMS